MDSGAIGSLLVLVLVGGFVVFGLYKAAQFHTAGAENAASVDTFTDQALTGKPRAWLQSTYDWCVEAKSKATSPAVARSWDNRVQRLGNALDTQQNPPA